jgi:hypothetical protein
MLNYVNFLSIERPVRNHSIVRRSLLRNLRRGLTHPSASHEPTVDQEIKVQPLLLSDYVTGATLQHSERLCTGFKKDSESLHLPCQIYPEFIVSSKISMITNVGHADEAVNFGSSLWWVASFTPLHLDRLPTDVSERVRSRIMNPTSDSN